MHPQTQGKIERWHQTLKNRILLENYFLPGDLEAQIEAFVEQYNHLRYYESLSNVTPADACFGRAPAIIKQRKRIKRQTIEHWRLQHRRLAATMNYALYVPSMQQRVFDRHWFANRRLPVHERGYHSRDIGATTPRPGSGHPCIKRPFELNTQSLGVHACGSNCGNTTK